MHWDDHLTVGVADIDEHHRNVLDKINRLLEEMKRGVARHSSGEFLAFTRRYVADHFAAEESYMRKYSYPNAPTHFEQHRAFLRRFELLERRFTEEGPSGLLIVDIEREIGEALVTHIEETDQAMGRFLKRKLGQL